MTARSSHSDSPFVGKQFEQAAEGQGGPGASDPLDEAACSPVPGLIRRLPGRALLLVTNRCFRACSFCNRRFFVNQGPGRSSPLACDVDGALDYIAGNDDIRDVILSGGDPMVLGDDDLGRLLDRLRAIDHVRMIRVGTRAAMVAPDRITESTAAMLARFRPLMVCVHFNHPHELTEKSLLACRRLMDRGLPLLDQTVLLAGINDHAGVLAELFWALALEGVRPYYLYQCDRVKGTERFWVPLERAMEIAAELAGLLPGHAVPRFAVDLPGLGGKAILHPQAPPERVDGGYLLPGMQGRVFYPDMK